MAVINLNNKYKELIHKPSINDKPLYAKVEGYSGEQDEVDIAINKDYEIASKVAYNSPSNIKRLFLTSSGAVVEYHTPYIMNTKKAYHKKVSFNKFDDDIVEMAKRWLSYDIDMRNYPGEKVLNPEAKKPEQYRFNGNGLGVTYKPWVTPNIEEIYFDWTIFLSEEVWTYVYNHPEFRQIIDSKFQGSQKVFIDTMVNNRINKGSWGTEGSTPIDLFYYCSNHNVKDLRNRYPRLKTVSFVSNLDTIMYVIFKNIKDGVSPGAFFDNKDLRSDDLWIKNINVQKILTNQGAGLAIQSTVITDLPKYNDEFKVQEGVYKFDELVFSGYVRGYKKKIEDILRVERYGASNIDEIKNKNTEIQDIEKTLVELEEKYGKTVTTKILRLAASEMKASEIKSILNTFTTAGHSKYSEMLGIRG